MVFLDVKCTKCGEKDSMIYSTVEDKLVFRCSYCGAELSHDRTERIRHYLDALVSAFSGSSFQVTTARFCPDWNLDEYGPDESEEAWD